MELDEIKTLWQEMSVRLDKQIELSEQMILDATQAKLEKQVNIFRNSQILVFVVACSLIGTLIFNLHKLDTSLGLTSAILWMIYLAVMPFYSSRAFSPLKEIDIRNLNYKENLSLFFKSRRRVVIVQKISMALNPFLFIGAMVLMMRLFLDTDVSILVSNSMVVSMLVITLLATMVALHLVYKKSNAYLASLREFISESESI